MKNQELNSDRSLVPPSWLIKQWSDIWHQAKVKHENLEEFIAANAAHWGADAELKACSKWVYNSEDCHPHAGLHLRTARRPKSINLKEQALTALHAIATGANDTREQLQDLTTIREALERLP